MNKNKIFAYIVLGMNTIAAWVSWAVLAGAILGEMKHVWLYPTLTFSFWAIAFTLSVILVKNRKFFFASLVLGALGYPVFFGFNFDFLGLLLIFLLFVLIERLVKREIERGVKINFYHIISYALKYFVTAICAIIALAYYFSILGKPAIPSATFLEKETLEKEMDWGLKAAGFVLSDDKKVLIDDINNNMTVDNFLSKNFVQPEVTEAQGSIESVGNITKLIGGAAALEIQQQMLDRSKKDLAKQLGVDVVGEQPMKEVLMAYIDKTERSFFEYSGTDKFYVPIILSFGIFLAARILGTAVDVFLGFLILGMIKLLQLSGIVQLKTERKEVMVIEYSV